MVFAASAALLLIEWWLLEPFRRPVAVIVYLHYGGLGALLVSGFWSIVNERFDPRTAKKHVGRIAAGATVGGLLGGLLAERVAATLSMAAMLPILASLHFLCALLVMGLKPSSATAAGSSRTPASNPTEKKERRSGLRIIAETSYLRSLVALVLLASVSEVLIDYVFKARASAAFGSGEDLLRLFGVFYTGVALLTVAIQTTASRLTLQKLGLARTVAILPSTLAVGSAGALFAPGLVSAAIARGAEAVMRNSLYRPAYELLFTPIGQRQKRATKTLVDVGVVRLGDMTGGALVQATLLVAAGSALAALLGFAIALAVVAGLVAIRLHRGYVRTLERSLVSRAAQLDLAEIEDVTTRTAMLQTVGTLGLAPISDESLMAPAAEAGPPSGAVMEAHPEPHLDPEVRRIVELRSGDPDGVRRALAGRPLTPTLVPHATPLLAWDQVAPQAIQALRDVAPIVTGQLVDRLLDRDEEFAVRRRIPLVLAACPTERAGSRTSASRSAIAAASRSRGCSNSIQNFAQTRNGLPLPCYGRLRSTGESGRAIDYWTKWRTRSGHRLSTKCSATERAAASSTCSQSWPCSCPGSRSRSRFVDCTRMTHSCAALHSSTSRPRCLLTSASNSGLSSRTAVPKRSRLDPLVRSSPNCFSPTTRSPSISTSYAESHRARGR